MSLFVAAALSEVTDGLSWVPWWALALAVVMAAVPAWAVAKGGSLYIKCASAKLLKEPKAAASHTTPVTVARYALVIGALAAFARQEGVELRHVKVHGALYNQAVNDRALADVIARAVRSFDKNLILVGLAGSAMVKAGIGFGLRVANEAFPDRRYNPDGSLMSRKQTGSLVGYPEEVAANAVSLARGGIDFAGKRVSVDTLCIHGDNARAAENARQVREALERARIQIQALGD